MLGKLRRASARTRGRSGLNARLRSNTVIGAIPAVALAAVCVVILFVFGTPHAWDRVHRTGVLAFVLVATLVVAGRRHAPVTVLFVALAAIALLRILGGDIPVTWAAVMLAAGTVGVQLGLARGLAVMLLAVVASTAALLLGSGFPGWSPYVAAMTALGVSWWIGRSLRMRRAYTAELEARAQRLERARDAYARAALAEERSRIARELHDVIAHHVSVMTVQATAAQRIFTQDPGVAREALTAIETTGRAALCEMRRLVGVLRTEAEADVGAERSPQPGIADLPYLVDQVRETGLAVDLRMDGTFAHVSPGIDLAAYRIVQEALTNTLKHAGSRSIASVGLSCADRHLDVHVADDGRGLAACVDHDPERPGHGLVGMRERVALYGGELRVGARPGGGFEVRARFPLGVTT